MTNAPPYNPGFGIAPPLLAGRTEILTHSLAALAHGPRARHFCQAFIGDRGVGKTVLLGEIERRAREDLHWAVLSHQAVRGGDLITSLVTKLPDAIRSTWQRTKSLVAALDAELSVAANVGVVKASATIASRPPPSTARTADVLERALRRAGEFAQRRHNGLLVTIDEAQVVEPVPDLAGLAAAVQMVTMRSELPIAVVLAGLPEFVHHARGAGTFFERLDTTAVGNLGHDSIAMALVKPASDRRVRFTDDALALLIDVSEGYPYLVQLVGWHSWQAASGSPTIDLDTARKGVREAQQRLSALFESRWNDLSGQQRRVVSEVARLGPGPARISDVAGRMGKDVKQIAMARQRLIDERGALWAPRRGEVAFVLQRFREWVLQHDLGDEHLP